MRCQELNIDLTEGRERKENRVAIEIKKKREIGKYLQSVWKRDLGLENDVGSTAPQNIKVKLYLQSSLRQASMGRRLLA